MPGAKVKAFFFRRRERGGNGQNNSDDQEKTRTADLCMVKRRANSRVERG